MATDCLPVVVQALQPEVTQLKEQVGANEQVAAAMKAELEHVEKSFQTANSLLIMERDLAMAKIAHMETVQVRQPRMHTDPQCCFQECSDKVHLWNECTAGWS